MMIKVSTIHILRTILYGIPQRSKPFSNDGVGGAILKNVGHVKTEITDTISAGGQK